MSDAEVRRLEREVRLSGEAEGLRAARRRTGLGGAPGPEPPARRALDRVKLLVRRALAPTLKRAGFRAKGVRFHRRQGASTQVVEVQSSAANSADEARFRVNAGVALDALADGGRAPATPMPAGCDWSCCLMENADAWWVVDRTCELEPLEARLEGAAAKLVTLLDALCDPRALLARRPGAEDRARLHYALGEDEAALATLQELATRDGESLPLLIRERGFSRLAAAHPLPTEVDEDDDWP